MAKLLREPGVYLVTHTAVEWDTVERMLADEGMPSLRESIRTWDLTGSGGDVDAVGTIEISARLCYLSFGKGRTDIADFVRNIMSKGDGSVLEHVVYGFCFTKVSRSYTHEQVRHRPGWAYSQQSQRFVDEGNAAFVIPPLMLDEGWEGAEEAVEILDRAAGAALGYYEQLVDYMTANPPPSLAALPATDRRKAVRSTARAVLPNANETRIFCTANVRGWRHWIGMRAHPAADWEIRRLAIKVLRILQAREPLLFGDYEIVTHTDGTEVAAPLYWKV